MAQAIAGKQFPFLWEGKDRKGNRVKGRGLAKDEAELRIDLRRQGIAVAKVRKERRLFSSGGQGQGRGHRALQPPARHHAHRRHPDGAGLRDHRRRPRQAGDAEARARDQVGHRDGQRAQRVAGEAPALFRRPVRQPGRGRRARGCARDRARQDRDLPGKDRGAEEEDQEGAVLPGGGAGGRDHRDGDPAAVRDPAVRKPVPGLRRRPARLHADGHRHVALDAGPRAGCC